MSRAGVGSGGGVVLGWCWGGVGGAECEEGGEKNGRRHQTAAANEDGGGAIWGEMCNMKIKIVIFRARVQIQNCARVPHSGRSPPLFSHSIPRRVLCAYVWLAGKGDEKDLKFPCLFPNRDTLLLSYFA